MVIGASQNGQTTSYTYGLERISAISGSKRTEYVHDGRGSVASEVTKNQAWYTLGGLLSGKDVSSKAYTPFGEQIGEAVSGFGYNGEYYNAATGQVYLRARFYEPELNRFSQKDIVRGEVTRPQGLNRYLYVENDPISYLDSSGEALGGFLKKAVNVVKKAAAPVVKKAATVISKKVTSVKKAVTPAKSASNTGKKITSSLKKPSVTKVATKTTNNQNAKLARMEKQLTPATVKKPIPPKQKNSSGGTIRATKKVAAKSAAVGSITGGLLRCEKEKNERDNSSLPHSMMYGSIVGGLAVANAGASRWLINGLETATRPNNIGAGVFAKNISQEIKEVEAFSRAADKTLTYAAFAAVAIDVGTGVYSNVKSGASTKDTISDAVVDTVVTGGSVLASIGASALAGAAAGTVVPGVGNLVGAGVGLLVGVGSWVLTDVVTNSSGKTLREEAKEWARDLW